MRQEELLINRLAAYARSDMYPFHMPGHKRRTGPEESFMNSCTDSFTNPFAVDITEIEGFDNLHHPEGILKDSMKWAADVYGADQTYYLINGSTGGILAAVCGSVPRGGRILVSRNCHKSVYHGICLNQLKASYVYPQEIEGLGIQGGITAEDVDRMLNRYMDTQAVLIVCPTYDGIVSDIEAIARIVHRAGLPLIVDEAHGAHFRYDAMFPVSALDLGADVVIQSVHKTLPSLTQTALLHIKCNRPDGGCYADRERIDRYIHMVQSSSPSYVLMASIENSIFLMDQYRKEGKVAEFEADLLKIRKKLEKMKYLRLVEENLVGTAGISDVDISKIVVSVRGSGLTGEMLSRILREKYHLEMEMCGADYVTAIAAIGDSKKGLKRLKKALLEIDKEMEKSGKIHNNEPEDNVYSRHAMQVLPVFKAIDGEKETVSLKESSGRICGEFAYIYPPGIPLLAPGERITEEILETLQDYIEKDLPVQGLEDTDLFTIQVMTSSGDMSI